jgi:hypothetical protein
MRAIRLTALFVVFIGATALYTASPVLAQQKYTVSQPTHAISKLTQEHIIEVGDVDGHKLRVYEVRNEYPQNDLAFAGVAVKEMLSHGVSDFVNGSGSFMAYNVFTMADGNKVFVRVTGTTQSNPAEGNRSSSVENFVGGTGKFKGIRGQMRNTLKRAPGSTTFDVQISGEYWIED